MNLLFFFFFAVNFHAVKPLFVKILTKESKVFVDKKYAVECSTIGSRPAAIMSWWKNNKQITEVVQNVSFYF